MHQRALVSLAVILMTTLAACSSDDAIGTQSTSLGTPTSVAIIAAPTATQSTATLASTPTPTATPLVTETVAAILTPTSTCVANDVVVQFSDPSDDFNGISSTLTGTTSTHSEYLVFDIVVDGYLFGECSPPEFGQPDRHLSLRFYVPLAQLNPGDAVQLPVDTVYFEGNSTITPGWGSFSATVSVQSRTETTVRLHLADIIMQPVNERARGTVVLDIAGELPLPPPTATPAPSPPSTPPSTCSAPQVTAQLSNVSGDYDGDSTTFTATTVSATEELNQQGVPELVITFALSECDGSEGQSVRTLDVKVFRFSQPIPGLALESSMVRYAEEDAPNGKRQWLSNLVTETVYEEGEGVANLHIVTTMRPVTTSAHGSFVLDITGEVPLPVPMGSEGG